MGYTYGKVDPALDYASIGMSQSKSQLLSIGDIAQAEARQEQLWRSLAASLAKDILPGEEVIRAHGLTQAEYNRISQHPVFRAILVDEMKLWASAENTPERIRLKYLSMVEQSAPEFFAAMVNEKESLADRTRVLQTIMKGAGIGQETMDAAKIAAANGNRVSITINMGDVTATYDKDLPPRVIDNNVNREATTIEHVPYMPPDDIDDEAQPSETDGDDLVRAILDN